MLLTFGVASLLGCASSGSGDSHTFEDWVPYAYVSSDPEGNILARGTLSMAPLRSGFRKLTGRWEVRAVGRRDHASFQVGTGSLEGQVSGDRVLIEFHPDTASTDHGFELSGNLTSDGARGKWGYTDEAGVHANQGGFSLSREP